MSNRTWRFDWQRMSRTADGTTGDKPKSYGSQGYLWGKYEAEGAAETVVQGATRTTVYGTITLRGFPTVTAKDRLVFVEFNETYLVDGVRRNFAKNELICDVHRLDVE